MSKITKEEFEELKVLYGEDEAKNLTSGNVDEDTKEDFVKLIADSNDDTFDIDLALDSYDASFPGYTPSDNALEFFNLMRLVQGGDFEFKTPLAHYFMVDLLLNEIHDVHLFPFSDEVCEQIEINHLRISFCCSRGVAKSTVVISFFGVYSAIKGKLPNGIGKVYFYLILAASTRGGARTNALAVRAMCEDSVFINNYFESVRYTETETEFVRKGTGPKKDRSFMIRYAGIGTGVRGIRYGERRPDLIEMDDIILNESAAYSKTISDNIDSIIYSDSEAALKGGGNGRIIMTFTPFHYKDNNVRTITSKTYTPCLIPIANTFDTENVKLKDIVSSWEAMHPAKTILSMVINSKRSNKMKSFMQERMLRLTSNTNRLVPDSCFKYYDAKNVINNLWAYNIYITTDYTTTSGENSDYSGIAAWAISNNGDYFLLDLYLRKMGMKEQYAKTLDLAAKYKRMGRYVEIGVEIDGNQGAHVYSLEQEMMKRADYYTFARDRNNKSNERKGILSRSSGVKKHERFRIAVTDSLLVGKMYFPEHLKDTDDFKEFLQQIKGATHEGFTRSDDGPDLITQLVTLIDIIIPAVEPMMNPENNLDRIDASIWGHIDDDESNSGSSEIF